MSTKTAQTLTLISGIFFLVEFVSKIIVGAWAWFFLPLLLGAVVPLLDPATLAMLTTIFNWFVLIIPIITLIGSIPTLVVAILTLRWRHTPELHKMGLITIGILGIIFLGTLPGVLALVAGILVEEPTKNYE